MANQNPILHNLRPVEPVNYSIAARHAQALLQVSFKIELLEKDWQHVSLNTIILAGIDKYPRKTPEPHDIELGRAQEVDGKNCYFASHISRLRNGSSSDTPARVRFTLVIRSGTTVLDSFSKESDTNNPSDFFALIQFKLQS